MAPKNNSRYTRSNPGPNLPAAFENPNLIPKILRKQEQREDFADNSPETVHPSSVPTPVKVLFRSAPASPGSSSTSQSTPFTPPITAHTTTFVTAVPVVPVVPLIPVNMANRYAPCNYLQILGLCLRITKLKSHILIELVLAQPFSIPRRCKTILRTTR